MKKEFEQPLHTKQLNSFDIDSGAIYKIEILGESGSKKRGYLRLHNGSYYFMLAENISFGAASIFSYEEKERLETLKQVTKGVINALDTPEIITELPGTAKVTTLSKMVSTYETRLFPPTKEDESQNDQFFQFFQEILRLFQRTNLLSPPSGDGKEENDLQTLWTVLSEDMVVKYVEFVGETGATERGYMFRVRELIFYIHSPERDKNIQSDLATFRDGIRRGDYSVHTSLPATTYPLQRIERLQPDLLGKLKKD